MNKLTDSQKRIIIVGIAIALIIFGAVQGIFKFKIIDQYKAVIDQVTFVLMLGAAFLFFNIKRGNQKEEEEASKESEPMDEVEKTEGVKEKE